jgi:hypothetical protein
MITLFQKTKKIVAVFAVVALLVVQNSVLVLGLGAFSRIRQIDTVEAIYNSTEITLSNSHFENPTSSSYPITASSWTKLDEDQAVTAGLINTSQSVYDQNLEDYNLTFNPGKASEVAQDENKVLMLNAQTTSTKMGYQSSSFVLAKNGYYTVEAWVYTQNYDGIVANASMYLTGDSQVEESANSKLLAINTQGVWKKYTFYVETSELSDKAFRLELYLGAKTSILSQGAVFFDNVKVLSHSHDMYYTLINNINYTDTNYSILNLKQNKVANAINNADFEEITFTGWETLTANNSIADSENMINGAFYVDANFNSTLTGVTQSPTNANRYDNQKALLINNQVPASIGFKSSDIVIEQHKLYKLNVWVKTGELTNGATIKLVENKEEEPLTSVFENVKTTANTNEKYGGWVQYAYLIEGSVFEDATVNLELWLGNDSQTEAGYVFYDNVELYELTTDEFNSLGTSTTVKELSLSKASQSPSIANGTFNEVIVSDVSESYPYQAKSWTITSNSENYEFAQTQNGIINTKTAHFNNYSANYSFVNPGNTFGQAQDEISDNVMVVNNLTATSQIITSQNKTLNASSYYQLNFTLQTQALSQNEVSIALRANATPVYTLHQLESNLAWTKYSIYIKTGLSGFDANFQLLLGSKLNEITGAAFLDNVTLSEIDAADYTNAIVNNTNKKVDFTYENFTTTSSTSVNGLYEALQFTGTNVSNTATELLQTGVLDTTNFNQTYFAGLDNPQSASETQNNVLVIASHDDAHYSYTSNLTYTLSANKYYKFTVFVKTNNLSQQETNQTKDENEQVVPYGVSIALTGFNNKFTGINTQQNQISNNYQEYSFYVSVASDKTTNLVLSLGDANALTKGYAFFSNISLTEVQEEAYSEALTLLASENPPANLLNLENAEVETDEEETEDPDENSGINFDFLLFPTLMFGLALIIAIIAYALRQIKFNRIIRRRIKTEIYDRNRTLSVDHERREVVKERQAKLLKLKEQLSQIQQELDQNEQAFKRSKQETKEVELTKAELDKTKEFNEKQLKAYKQKQKAALRKKRQQEYLEKRERLQKEFDRIEKEIEKLEREERIMFEKYRNYKAQVKAIKLEIKQKTKEARIKRKLKRKKAQEKKKGLK